MNQASRSLMDALCREHFAAFVAKSFSVVHSSERRFINAWHVKAMCEAMEEAVFGDHRRLVISVPPRHLKSFTAAVALPAFILGHRPDCRIMVANYALDIGRAHAQLCRKLLGSDWYRDLFSRAVLDRCAGDHLRTTAGGDRFTVSVGGTVTGFAADIIVIDDLLNASDAASPAERSRAQSFIDGALLTRFDDPARGSVISIQQRLHEDDPAGHLIAKGYRLLNLPAIAPERAVIPIGRNRYHTREPGESLFPELFGLEVLENLRRELGSTVFNMQYQQDPVAASGSPLRWEWFRTYDKQMARDWYQFVVQSWDTAMSADPRADFSVCTTWGFREGLWYLLDVFRDRLDYPPLRNKVIELCRRWEVDRVVIEDAGSGKPLLQDIWQDETLRRKFRRGWSSDPKEVRFLALQAMAEARQIVLPQEASWMKFLRDEVMGFPNARYDDQVDSISQFCEWARLPRTNGTVRAAGASSTRRQARE